MRLIALAFAIMLSSILPPRASAQINPDYRIAERLFHTSKAYDIFWRNDTQSILIAQEYLGRAAFLFRCKSLNYHGLNALINKTSNQKIQDLAQVLKTEMRSLEKQNDVRIFSYRVPLASVSKLTTLEKEDLDQLIQASEFEFLVEFGELRSFIQAMDELRKFPDKHARDSGWLLVNFKKFVMQSSQRYRYISVLRSLDQSLFDSFSKIQEENQYSQPEVELLRAIADRHTELSQRIQEGLLDSLNTKTLELAYKLDTHPVTGSLNKYSVVHRMTDSSALLIQRVYQPGVRFNCTDILPPKEDDLLDDSRRQYLIKCAKAYQEAPFEFLGRESDALNALYPMPSSISAASHLFERAKQIVQPSCKSD